MSHPRLLQDGVVVHARRSPERPAVVDPHRTVTYGELDAAANHLARALLARGVAVGDRVGIWMPKSAYALAAMQAVLRVGAVYVPLDPQSPLARIRTIVANCDMKVVIGSDVTLSAAEDIGRPLLGVEQLGGEALFHRASEPVPQPAIDPEDLAYILYTSGTTGVPKGVCVSHRAALAFVDWGIRLLDVGPEDRLANHAPLHFDLSVFDVYAALHTGARVVIVPEGSSLLGTALVAFIARHGITIWYSVPSALVMMMDQGGLLEMDPCPLRTIFFAGEVFPIKQLRQLRRGLPRCRMFNLYGPTETNVCTYFEVTSIEPERTIPIPIGRACCGDRASARAEDGTVVGVGGVGELWVEGPTVMSGYWGHPAQGPAYGTGDVVRVLEDGVFEFIGRRDHMVKIRGHRVELGEIEAALLAHPAVREACALVWGEGLGMRLVAYLACAPGHSPPSLIQIKTHCQSKLPRYMIVDAVRYVDELPRTRNGKIDRRSLAASHVPADVTPRTSQANE
ncbi:amino acid adenylation domain-containing protein [Pendulispora albinea]|uniref:Amino acid adenylation domain-containing protein n=1 Tax=Pendulispora albinea TaxID=2741071 RepID=A0ABZ2M409_9BACT